MTLLERANNMLSQAKLSKEFWAKVINMTFYLVNKSLQIILEMKTPYKIWFGSLIDYSKLKVFDCLIYAHVKKGKLGSKARKCIFLGYVYGSEGMLIVVC